MKKSYNEMYLDDGMRNMGEMLDYAVNECGLDVDQFWELFLASGLAKEIEHGNPAYISGLSGTELARETFSKVNYHIDCPKAQIEYSYSPEYWSGWILAYYQWYSGRKFQEIYQTLHTSEVCDMYYVYHEMSEQQFVDAIEIIMSKKCQVSNVQMLRRMRGYSQRILAEKAGVNLRTLQQYESRAKDINKASVSSLRAIADALGCDITDLMES